ncbi:MAG: protein translocase subunit SecD, partial [Microvirga sp.]
MLRFSRSKIIATVAIIVIGLLLAVPSTMNREQRQAFLNAVPSWVPSWLIPSRAIVLGLDLQGGSHVLLEVDGQDLLRAQITILRDDVRRILRDTRVSSQNGIQTTPRGVQIRVPDAADRERLLPRLRELSQPIGNTVLGQTGNNAIEINTTPDGVITLTYTDAGINERVRRAVDQSIEVVRRRIDFGGTTEPSIQRQGADRILVQVPGLQDPQQLKALLGETGNLEFRLLAQPGATDVDMLPMEDAGGQRVPVERRVIAEGGDLTDAQPAFDSQTRQPIVNFR